MPFCLLTDRWIPVLRRDGCRDRIAPPGIAATEANPVVALDWPRPDFRLACTEFLIGLLATACPPADNRDWIEWYRQPPDAEALAAAFAPLADAFALDGDGARFMQDREDFASDANEVGALLIEAPGENTIKRNTDLMVRRGRVRALSRAAAATALYTLQTYAPSGGAGNRTSLRGGGPLTTLAIPPPMPGHDRPLLWHLLWSNVPEGEPPDAAELPLVFPWLRATRTSDKAGRATTPADAHRLQAWWGMPRRVRLDFTANQDGTACDLTGEVDTVLVRSWRQRPWGVNYMVWGGVHPLSPCYRVKPEAELLYTHPQPGGIGYQHWLGLLSPNAAQRPNRGKVVQVASSVASFRDRVRDVHDSSEAWRLLAAGYDMDNMKARGFAESEMPVVEPRSPEMARVHDALLGAMVRGAGIVADVLARCVRLALFGGGRAVPKDDAVTAALRERFWADTTNDFFVLAASSAFGMADEAARKAWHRTLDRTARTLFDEVAPVDASGEGRVDRVTSAARQLGRTLTGYGEGGKALFDALGLNMPDRLRKAKAAGRR